MPLGVGTEKRLVRCPDFSMIFGISSSLCRCLHIRVSRLQVVLSSCFLFFVAAEFKKVLSYQAGHQPSFRYNYDFLELGARLINYNTNYLCGVLN